MTYITCAIAEVFTAFNYSMYLNRFRLMATANRCSDDECLTLATECGEDTSVIAKGSYVTYCKNLK